MESVLKERKLEWYDSYVGQSGVAAKYADKAADVKKHIFHFMAQSDNTKELGNSQARTATEYLKSVGITDDAKPVKDRIYKHPNGGYVQIHHCPTNITDF